MLDGCEKLHEPMAHNESPHKYEPSQNTLVFLAVLVLALVRGLSLRLGHSFQLHVK